MSRSLGRLISLSTVKLAIPDAHQGRLLPVHPAETATLTRNEILTGAHSPEHDILAIVEVDGGQPREPCCARQPSGHEPEFGVTRVTYDLGKRLARSQAAS